MLSIKLLIIIGETNILYEVDKMAERVGNEKIEREDGYLYYLGKDGYVWRTPMRSNLKGRTARIGNEHIEREEGYLYFVDKEGYVSRVKMVRK